MSTTASRETVGLVLAHGKVADVVARHALLWAQQARELFYFTPVDDPLPFTRRQFSAGKSKAYSADTNIRIREALRFGSLQTCKYVLLIEYDSMIFGDIPVKHLPPAGGVTAPVFHDPNNAKFKGQFFTHFPQLFTRTGAKAVVEAMDNLPEDAELGFSDRYVGYAIAQAGIPVHTLDPYTPGGLAFTKNVIDDSNLAETVAAYRAGARWTHGIKTFKVLQALQTAIFDSTPN